MASTLNPNVRSSFFFDEDRDKFELRGGDGDNFSQYSVSGSRAGVNTRNGEVKVGHESTQSRWSLASMQEIRKMEEEHDQNGGKP